MRGRKRLEAKIPVIIKPFTPGDVTGLLLVQEKSHLSETWKTADYLRLSEEAGVLVLVAQEEPRPGRIVGFAELRRVLDHAEILNLAVEPGRRRLGIGKSLLRDSCRQVHKDGAKAISLEVRASNAPAIALYHSMGFLARSVRKLYYTDPVEDACVLWLDLPLRSK